MLKFGLLTEKQSKILLSRTMTGFIYNPEKLDLSEINIPCHSDYARMFVHLIITRHFKKNCKEAEYIPLKALFLRKQIHAHHTEEIKNALCDAGIIECDGIYHRQLKCLGFRLTERYRKMPVERIKINKSSLAKKLKKPKPIFATLTHETIWNWLDKTEVDYKNARKALDGQQNLSQKSLMLEKLKARDWFFHVDQRGRVYHNVACLWSKFRKYLTINGEGLVNIDVMNSQPLIFSKILKDNLYYISYPSTTYDALFEDVVVFVQLVEKGELYDFLMQKIGFTTSRGSFKKKFFAEVLYAKNGVISVLSKQFDILFPNVVKIITNCKRDDYRDLPLQMQRIEAEVMVSDVCFRLSQLGIPFLPIHDSILSPPKYAEQVSAIMKDAFSKIGLFPRISHA